MLLTVLTRKLLTNWWSRRKHSSRHDFRGWNPISTAKQKDRTPRLNARRAFSCGHLAVPSEPCRPPKLNALAVRLQVLVPL